MAGRRNTRRASIAARAIDLINRYGQGSRKNLERIVTAGNNMVASLYKGNSAG